MKKNLFPILMLLVSSLLLAQSSDTRKLVEKGMALRAKKDYKEALSVLSKAVKADPGFSEAWRQRGLVYSDLEKWRKAKADFERAIQADPRNAKAYVGRAFVKSSKKDWKGAVADCSQAIAIDPKYANAYMNRASSLYRMGELKTALADLDRCLKLDPKNALAFYSRAVVKTDLKDLQGAGRDLTRSLQIDGNHAFADSARQRLAKLPASGAPKVAPPAPAKGTVGTGQQKKGQTGRTTAAPVRPKPLESAPEPSMPAVVPYASAAQFERLSIPLEQFDEARYPAAERFAPEVAPAPLPVAPSRALAHIPENLDINHLAPAAYNAVVVAAKEGMRLLLGPMEATDEERFEKTWAPLFEYPCQPVIEYFNRLNPLLNRFIETRSALNMALFQFNDAYETAIAAAGLQDDEAVQEAMEVVGIHRHAVAALDARLIETARAIEALGEPPDPLVHKAKARKINEDALKFCQHASTAVEEVSDTEAGTYWVMSELKVEANPYQSDSSTRKTFSHSEGFAAGSVQVVETSPTTGKVIQYGKAGTVTWTPPKRLIPESESQYEYTVETASTKPPPAFWAEMPCATFSIETEYGNQRDNLKATLAKPNDKKTATLLFDDHRGSGVTDFGFVVHVSASGGEATYTYSYSKMALNKAQIAEIEAKAAQEADQQAKNKSDAQARQSAAEAEAEQKTQAIALCRANQQHFQEQLDRYQSQSQTASPQDRERYDYLSMVARANLQAERDNQTTMETGQWTRTRTDYDDWNFHYMAAQGQQAAEEWRKRTAALAAVPNLIAQLPPEMRESQRFLANAAIEAAVSRGDYEELKSKVHQLADNVKEYWTRRKQAQEHIAEVSDTALTTASTLRSGADTALFTLSMFGGAPIYTGYMAITSGIDAYHAPTVDGGKGGLTGGIVGMIKGVVSAYHPAAMVAVSAYDGYNQVYRDASGRTVQGGVEGAAKSAATSAIYALAMQKVVGPVLGRFIQKLKGQPVGKWPTVEQQLGDAQFKSRYANGRALVRLFQERVQLLRLARSSNDRAMVARLEEQARQAAQAIKCDYTAKMVLNQVGKNDPPTMKMYLAMDKVMMEQVEKTFAAKMKAQGYTPAEVRSFSNSASSGRAGMDVDIGLVEPPRFIRGADGKPMRNPVWDHWRKNNLCQTDASGRSRRVSLSEYQQKGQQTLQAAFNEVYGGPGRSTQGASVNFTTSLHSESYADMGWIGRRGLPHADFDAIDPRSAQQAGDVTAFKIGHNQGTSISRNPDYLTMQEGCRTLVKDMNTKLIGNRAPAGQAPVISPNAPLAKASPQVQRQILELRQVMDDFAGNRIGPIEAERRIKQLTGGQGLPAVVATYQDLLIAFTR